MATAFNYFNTGPPVEMVEMENRIEWEHLASFLSQLHPYGPDLSSIHAPDNSSECNAYGLMSSGCLNVWHLVRYWRCRELRLPSLSTRTARRTDPNDHLNSNMAHIFKVEGKWNCHPNHHRPFTHIEDTSVLQMWSTHASQSLNDPLGLRSSVQFSKHLHIEHSASPSAILTT